MLLATSLWMRIHGDGNEPCSCIMGQLSFSFLTVTIWHFRLHLVYTLWTRLATMFCFEYLLLPYFISRTKFELIPNVWHKWPKLVRTCWLLLVLICVTWLAEWLTDWWCCWLVLCWLRGCTNLWSLADNRLIGGGAASSRCLANWGAGGTGNCIWTGQVWQFFILACRKGSKDIYCKGRHQVLHNRYTQFFLIWKNGSISGVPECITSELFSSYFSFRDSWAEAKTRTLS